MKTFTIATRFAANLEYLALNDLNPYDQANLDLFCTDLNINNPGWQWTMDTDPVVSALCAISRQYTECFVVHIH